MASVGEIVSFMGIAMLLIGRLETTSSFVANLFFKLPALEEFFSILDAQSTVPDKPNARRLWAPRGEVAFDGVSFAYPGGTNVLSDTSFVAQPGTSIALVGHTGAGKSTAMALLQRLWDPTEGRVTIDGQDLRDVTLESLRAHVGVVFQDSMLFNRSIRDNLLVGRAGRDRRGGRAGLPHGRCARVHHAPAERLRHDGRRAGRHVVRGAAQRLAIARALLKDPPILILDEATSALDARPRRASARR